MAQQALADVLGIHVLTVSSWERGTRQPNADSLAALAGALEVSADYLLGRTDDSAGGIRESDLSALELEIVRLLRQRNLPTLLSAISDTFNDGD